MKGRLWRVRAVRLLEPDLKKYHRVQIRWQLGFRGVTRADEERLTMWLAAEVCAVELVEDRQREALLRRFARSASSRLRARSGSSQQRAVSPTSGSARRR